MVSYVYTLISRLPIYCRYKKKLREIFDFLTLNERNNKTLGHFKQDTVIGLLHSAIPIRLKLFI